MTQHCDESTARQARHEGWNVELLHDATGSVPFANDLGSASAEEIHRVFTLVSHTGFAAVASTGQWLAAVATGEALQPDNLYLSNQRAVRAAADGGRPVPALWDGLPALQKYSLNPAGRARSMQCAPHTKRTEPWASPTPQCRLQPCRRAVPGDRPGRLRPCR